MKNFFQKQFTLSTIIILFAFMWIGQVSLCSQAGNNGGGGCYTNYGQNTCVEGFQLIYSGVLTMTVLFSGGSGSGAAGSVYCLSDLSTFEKADGYYPLFSQTTGMYIDETKNDMYLTNKAIPCAVCCK